jgi:hypothetical protein
MTYATFEEVENTDEDIEIVEHYHEDIKKIDIARQKGNALKYFNLCNDIGIFPELSDKKGMELYSRGEDLYKEQRERDSVIEEIVDDEGEKLEKIARTALIRFPELQRGESITSRELSRKLNQIRDAGYEIPSYSKLRKKEKWDLLMKIRKDLWSKLQSSNPIKSYSCKRD